MTKEKRNKIILLALGCILLVVLIYQSFDYYQRQKDIDYSMQYRWLSLQEIIDKGMDENDTAKNALSLKNDLDSYIASNGYTVELFEIFPSKYGEKADLNISLHYTLKKGEDDYRIDVDFKNGVIDYSDIDVYGKRYDINKYPLEELDIKYFLEKLEFKDIYQLIVDTINDDSLDHKSIDIKIPHDKYLIFLDGNKEIDVYHFSFSIREQI